MIYLQFKIEFITLEHIKMKSHKEGDSLGVGIFRTICSLKMLGCDVTLHAVRNTKERTERYCLG